MAVKNAKKTNSMKMDPFSKNVRSATKISTYLNRISSVINATEAANSVVKMLKESRYAWSVNLVSTKDQKIISVLLAQMIASFAKRTKTGMQQIASRVGWVPD